MQFRLSLNGVKILFRLGVGGLEVPLLIWEVPLLIWLEVPLLIWEVPLLIWWVGGKMNSRIRLTSAKVGVEVEAELGNKKHMITHIPNHF